jgi:hypothetical protein
LCFWNGWLYLALLWSLVSFMVLFDNWTLVLTSSPIAFLDGWCLGHVMAWAIVIFWF